MGKFLKYLIIAIVAIWLIGVAFKLIKFALIASLVVAALYFFGVIGTRRR